MDIGASAGFGFALLFFTISMFNCIIVPEKFLPDHLLTDHFYVWISWTSAVICILMFPMSVSERSKLALPSKEGFMLFKLIFL